MSPMLIALIGAGTFSAGRLVLFCVTVVTHLRWKVPVATLERLLRASAPAVMSHSGRRVRHPK
jgi:hypothetical protein